MEKKYVKVISAIGKWNLKQKSETMKKNTNYKNVDKKIWQSFKMQGDSCA